MRRASFYILINIILLAQANAQETTAGIEMHGDYFSNALSNRFVDKLLMSRYINDDIKSTNRIRSHNNAFADFGGEIYYSQVGLDYLGMKNAGYKIALKTRTMMSTEFSGDAYHIVFEGNQAYAGETANLNPFRMNRQSFQTMEYGIFKNLSAGGWNYNIYGGLGLVKGQKFDRMSLDRGSLFTADDGSYLDVDMNANYKFCESSKNPFALNGLGASAHLIFKAEADDKNTSMVFEVSDLGFIRWMNSAREARFDSAFRFEGLPVNLFSDSLSGSFIGDTLQSLMDSHIGKYRKSTMMPAVISFMVTKKLSDKYYLTAGARYYGYSKMPAPYIIVDMKYLINDNMNISGLFRYGFYNNLNIGFSYNITVAEKWRLRFDWLNLPAFILPAKTRSQGLFLSVGYKI